MDLSNPTTGDVEPRQPAQFLRSVDDMLDWIGLAPLMDAISARGQARLPLSAVKLALLQRWYGIHESALRHAVMDRLSFRAFVGYLGDGGLADAEILSELESGFWRNQAELRSLVNAVEDQLRAQGFTVRHGQLVEASIIPSTEAGLQTPAGIDTSPHEAAALGRMLEAATAKAQAEGRIPSNSAPELETVIVPVSRVPQPDDQPLEARESVTKSPAPGGEELLTNDHIRAVLRWPWGQKTELTEHLNIGREFGFSPFARELAPYTHMSRRHAELLVYGDGVWVRDLGSRNGTFVNGEEVPKGQAYLIDCDAELRFGPNLAVELKIVT